MSRNRNNCLRHATADLCLIGDDDCRYTHEQLQAVINTFEQNPNVDIATFQYSSKGRLNGWGGNRDLDIAYLTPEQWRAYATGGKQEETKPAEPVTEIKLPELKRGSKGVAVIWIQSALGGLDVDGDFGWKTMNRVIEFQKEHGIEPTGTVNNLTWANIIHTL